MIYFYLSCECCISALFNHENIQNPLVCYCLFGGIMFQGREFYKFRVFIMKLSPFGCLFGFSYQHCMVFLPPFPFFVVVVITIYLTHDLFVPWVHLFQYLLTIPLHKFLNLLNLFSITQVLFISVYWLFCFPQFWCRLLFKCYPTLSVLIYLFPKLMSKVFFLRVITLLSTW